MVKINVMDTFEICGDVFFKVEIVEKNGTHTDNVSREFLEEMFVNDSVVVGKTFLLF